MAISFRQLEYLDAVAEAGSVTQAAKALFVSQSAISTALGDLEAELDVKLFVRRPRGLTLSREGVEILRHSRAVLKSVGELKNVASKLNKEVSGTLSIGIYATLAPRLVPAIVEQFAREHPDLHLHFSEGSRSRLLKGIQRGEYDAIVLYDYHFDEDLSQYGEVHWLSASRPYALLPNSHRLAGTGVVKLEDLIDDPFVLFELEPAARYFLSLFSSKGLTPRVEHRTGSFEIIRSMVARGMGYSLMTQRTVSNRSYEDVGFSPAELQGEFAALDVVAVIPQGFEKSRKIEMFLDASSSIYQNIPRYD